MGHGDVINITRFEEVRGLPNNICEIICGAFHTIILLRNGRILSCGYNGHGQLGQGDTNNRAIFEEIIGIPNNTSEVVCGYQNTFIRLTDGIILRCGRNIDGELGLGNIKYTTIFEEIKEIKI